jgi:hypothetical protein
MSTLSKVIIGLVIISIFTVPAVGNAIAALLFAGIVSGISYELLFWAVVLLLALAGYFAIRWLSRDTLYIGDSTYDQKQAKADAREYVLDKVAGHAAPAPAKKSLRRKRAYRVATSQ